MTRPGWRTSEAAATGGAGTVLAMVALDGSRPVVVQCLAVCGVAAVAITYTLARVAIKHPWLIPSLSLGRLLKTFLPRGKHSAQEAKS